MTERIITTGGEILLAQSALADGNMAWVRGDREETLVNRRLFLGKMGLEAFDLTMGALVHGNNCRLVEKSEAGKGGISWKTAFSGTDALVTAEKGVILGVTTADCLPVFLWSEGGEAIGIAHAGWKGLAGGVVKELVEAAAKIFPAERNKFFIRIGVGIGACCYTVDVERLKQFHGYHWCEIHWREGEKVHLDLGNVAMQQAVRKGIPRENISKWEGCSCCGKEYPSHRRDRENFQPDLAVIVCQKQG